MEIESKSGQLELDLQELETLLSQAQRSNVKFIIQNAIQSLKTEVSKVKNQQSLEKLQEQPKKIQGSNAPIKTNIVYSPFGGYSWEQENNHVKIYISLEKIGELAPENIVCDFQDQAFDLKVHEFQKKNLRLSIKKLNDKIEIKSCKCNQKKNMIIIDMIKGTSKFWDALEYKESPIAKNEKKEDIDKNDPQSSLMNMMKKMYQEGDDEMKKTIAQAWTKSQDEKSKDKAI